jgi:hypothetical protein
MPSCQCPDINNIYERTAKNDPIKGATIGIQKKKFPALNASGPLKFIFKN